MATYYWLDDNPERSTAAENLTAALNTEVVFWNLQKTILEKELSDLVAKAEPALVILDHNLEDADRGVFKKGSTAAAFVRDAWPECPIICVTGEDVHHLNSQQKALYEEVIPISKISDHYNTIRSIANSFEQLKKHRPANSGDLLYLLQTPEIDHARLASVLPTALKENFADRGLFVEISRWVRGTLLERPGFLYNRLWVSTLLGLKEDGFSEVEHLFQKAKYIGLFASKGTERWWKSTTLEILADQVDAPGLPWEKGRHLPSINDVDFSSCYVSEEPYPETVAFTDQSQIPTEAAMKMKYTILHPDFERLVYFDDIRLMKPAE